MRIYVVVSVYAGCVSEVKGFQDAGEAEMELARVRQELGIMPGEESESQYDVQLHEIGIVLHPASVAARRQVW